MSAQTLLESRQGVAVEDSDDALGPVPADVQLGLAPAADELDVACGGQQVLLQDADAPARVRGEDEPLGCDRDEARRTVDVRDQEIVDAFLFRELDSPALEDRGDVWRWRERSDCRSRLGL